MKDKNMYVLEELRRSMDEIDNAMIVLLGRRMRLSERIFACKHVLGLPITDMERERMKINAIAKKSSPEVKPYARILYALLAEMSKEHQRSVSGIGSRHLQQFDEAARKSGRQFPANVTVGCVGGEGTFSQLACDKLFGVPVVLYFRGYEGVISAVASGLCRYGVLPLESGSHGSIDRTYELMVANDLHIVRAVKVQLDFNVVGREWLDENAITHVYLTANARESCEEYLSKLENATCIICDDAAAAAKLAKESIHEGSVAITTYGCAQMYDLMVIAESIQKGAQRYSTFACISKEMEIYPGSNKTSLVMTVANKPGELYNVLSKFRVHDVNITKIETREIPGRDFEQRVFLDFSLSIYSESFRQLMAELDDFGREIHYLGSYLEV